MFFEMLKSGKVGFAEQASNWWISPRKFGPRIQILLATENQKRKDNVSSPLF
jgi:hypothetical protein